MCNVDGTWLLSLILSDVLCKLRRGLLHPAVVNVDGCESAPDKVADIGDDCGNSDELELDVVPLNTDGKREND
jgi:hypothetical protein